MFSLLSNKNRVLKQVLRAMSQLTIVDVDLAGGADGSPVLRHRAAFRADVPNFRIAD